MKIGKARDEAKEKPARPLRARVRFLANRHWLLGFLLAMAGVVVSRLAAPLFPMQLHKGVAVAGQLVAILGLFVIAYGINKRMRKPELSETLPEAKT